MYIIIIIFNIFIWSDIIILFYINYTNYKQMPLLNSLKLDLIQLLTTTTNTKVYTTVNKQQITQTNTKINKQILLNTLKFIQNNYKLLIFNFNLNNKNLNSFKINKNFQKLLNIIAKIQKI